MIEMLRLTPAFAVAVALAATPPIAPPQTSRVVRVPGTELRYLRVGRGPTLLVVGSSVYYPKVFSRNLESHFEIVYVDTRPFVPAYLPSAGDLRQLTLDRFADDVESVRQALGLDRVAVVGHSVFGQVALRYAQRYGDRISHLVIVCGIPFAASEAAPAVNAFWEKDATAERKALLARGLTEWKAASDRIPPTRTFAAMNRAYGPRFWANPAFDASGPLDGLENSPAPVFDRLRELVPGKAEVKQALGSLKVPVWVATGRFDYAAPHALWQDLVAGVPNVTLRLFARSGHNPQAEDPGEFDRALADWYRGHKGGAATSR